MVDVVVASGIVPRTFRSAPSSHALRRGPRPLTAAGGQGPQDNTACDIIQIRFIPLKLPCACGWPPTSAGDQDPQDNTAFDRAHIRSCRLKPGGLEHPHSVPYHPHMALAIQYIASHPSALRLCVQFIFLPAWDYLPSYTLGPSAIAGMPFFK